MNLCRFKKCLLKNSTMLQGFVWIRLMVPTWREAMQPAMTVRKDWLKAMMRRGLQVLVALEKSEGMLRSLSARNRKTRELVIHGKIPKGLID